MIALGMMALIALRKSCKYLAPLCMYLTPTHDGKKEPISEVERIEIADKIERHIVDTIIYTTSGVWGLIICKDQDWMPWYLGGHGDFAAGFANIPFFPVENSILFYGCF